MAKPLSPLSHSSFIFQTYIMLLQHIPTYSYTVYKVLICEPVVQSCIVTYVLFQYN